METNPNETLKNKSLNIIPEVNNLDVTKEDLDKTPEEMSLDVIPEKINLSVTPEECNLDDLHTYDPYDTTWKVIEPCCEPFKIPETQLEQDEYMIESTLET